MKNPNFKGGVAARFYPAPGSHGRSRRHLRRATQTGLFPLHPAKCCADPQIAGAKGTEVQRLADWMLDECEAWLSGNPVRYEVTRENISRIA